MSRTIQFKRRQASEIANTVGANGEIIIDITNNVLTVHDGVTPGGHALPNEAYVDEKIADLVDGAPGLLDTLKELADAINDDPNFFSNVQSSITTANTNMKLYVDGQIANVSGNTGGATQLAQAAYNQGNSTAIVANTGVDLAQSAFSTANTKANTADLANVAFTGSYNDLTNVPEGYSNSNVALYLANYDGTINFTASPAIISGVGTLSTYEVITGTINNPDGNVTLTANDGVIAHTWSFEADGGLRTPNNQLTIGGYTILTNNNNEIDLGNGDDITIRSNTGNVSIGTDWDNQQRNWTFGEYGRLYFPGIEESEYTIGETEGGIELSSSHGAYISTNTSTVAHSWSFQQDGDLYIPGVIRYSNGVNILDNVGVTGNIFIASACSAINFVANSSGDGSGFSTIELVPDTNATQDQYIIIDPTAPSHIHIRAGGTQDSSSADLFLGGEKNYVRVGDGSGVRLQNQQTTDVYNYYAENSQYTSGTWYEESGNYFVQFTTDDSNMASDWGGFVGSNINEIIVYWDTGTDGITSNVMTSAFSYGSFGNVYFVQVNQTLPANNTTLTAIEFHNFTTQTNYARLENNDFEVDVRDDVRITGRDVVSLRNWSTSDPITIVTDYDGAGYTWRFNSNATLEFPDGTTQNTAYPGPQDLSSYATLTDLSNSNTWLQQYTNTVVSAANTDMKIYVDASVSALINSAPATLDTLKELADALGDDSNFANTVLTIVGTKANTAELSNVAFSGSYNDLTNLPPVNQIFDTSNGAYNQANSANSLAQAAFDYANTIISDTGIDQYARDTANTASNNIVVLQGVNTTQNTNITNANNLAQDAYNKANSANVLAQAAFDAANTGASNVDQFARDTANSANILAQAAFNQANTGSGTQTYANSNVVSLLSSFGSNNITTTGNVSTGKITTTGNTSNGVGAIVAGVTNTLLPNTITSFSANVNNYTQVTFQNKNTGTDATADFILTADNGNDTTNFGDLGIINSGYDNNTPTNSLGNIVFAADTYLYAQGNVNNTSQSGGNLVIGTATTGKAVKVFAGGNNANALVATITGGSVTVTGNITASGTITTNNIIGTSANVTITANSYVSTFDTLGKLTLPGEVVMPNRTAFRVYGANTTGSLSTTQNGTGILNYNNWAVDYQQGNSLNVVSGFFTAPANGLYQICVNGRNAGNTTSISQLTCYRNNANVLTMLEFGANSSMNHAGTSTVAKLNTGDTLNIKVTAGTITFDGNDSWSVTYLG